jgi:hypothetical protein
MKPHLSFPLGNVGLSKPASPEFGTDQPQLGLQKFKFHFFMCYEMFRIPPLERLTNLSFFQSQLKCKWLCLPKYSQTCNCLTINYFLHLMRMEPKVCTGSLQKTQYNLSHSRCFENNWFLLVKIEILTRLFVANMIRKYLNPNLIVLLFESQAKYIK